jgi:hypothetical protein
MKIALVCCAAALILSGCLSAEEQDSRAKEVIEANGFRNIRMTGYDWYACGEDDDYSRGFEADGANDTRVTGVACAGAGGKGWTVRVTGVAHVLYAGRPATVRPQ